MKRKSRDLKKEFRFLIGLILLLLILNYPSLNNTLIDFLDTKEEVHVDRVIDGDTIESNKSSVRMLGINTPERGEYLYQEAKNFLNEAVLDRNVTLEFVGDREDKYRRTLAYVFLGDENINVKMVENGFANHYFYSGRDKYSDELVNAWQTCIENKENLCEPSENVCGSCVEIANTKDSVVNSCGFMCNINGWQIKGEGREKFIFSEGIIESGEKSYFALNIKNSGGSLFLRDSQGKLVDWKSS